MLGPDTPESLARILRDETALLRADPFLGARAIAAAKSRAELERPALVVIVFATALSLWLSLQAEGARPYEDLEYELDAAEASL